jgi:hypothetical protein
LVTTGHPVRLLFEGWPAVQFVGLPGVSRGTFGGKVAFIDPTDDGKGKFRVVVVPDDEDAPWPDADHLRQGNRAKGLIVLRRVTAGYELWRRINAFPLPPEVEKGDKPVLPSSKKPKVPAGFP